VLSYPALAIPERTVEVSPPVITPRRGTVRVGIVGAGAFAAGTLIPALAKAERVHLASIASARGFSARHLAEKYGFPTCTTDTDALIASDVDAVVIATRHDQHAALSARALRAGRHVFVEKPLALDGAQLDDVMAAQRESGRILTVGYNRRFAPLAVELAGLFTGRVGPVVMHYRVNAGPLPADSWIYDPALGGGRIVGEVCHFVDFCSFIAGAAPVEVMARAVGVGGGVRPDENVTLSLSFADGSLATIAYVATGDPSAGKERIEVIGEGACGYLEDFRVLDLYRGGKPRFVRKLSQDKGHRAEVDTFIAAVRAGGPPPIDHASLVATSRTTFAALESLATGRPVPVLR
jgi:predicted dehydrogenase